MIALILAPVKGTPPYPPLAICALKGWLAKYNISSLAIDLNKELLIGNVSLYEKINCYFGRPQTYLNNVSSDALYNIDTIYNLRLLLKFLYFDQIDMTLSDSEFTFYKELSAQLDKDVNRLLNSGLKIFGFSTFVSNIGYSILLASKLKKKDASIITVFGGCSTAYAPIRGFLLNSGFADYILVGEGEKALLKLCDDLLQGKPDYKIIYSENIAPLNLSQNEITVPIIKDLDILPFPDFSDLNLDNYTPADKKKCRVLSISTSRGCINRCAYCSETQYWTRYRQRTVESVINEIRYDVKHYHSKIFFFCDSLINGNVKWLKELCNKLIESKLNIQWLSYATINHLPIDLLLIMRKSGCISLTLGIEHISPEVLKGVNKISSIGNAKKTLLECVKVGIFPVANIIYALPNERKSDFLNLLYFVTDPELINVVKFTFRAYEIRVGSVVTENLMENSDAFVKHGIEANSLDSSIRKFIDMLDLYWRPDKDYIKETINKFNILANIMEHQNSISSLNITNVRNYNFNSVLELYIQLDSIPFIRLDEVSTSAFQRFLLSWINGQRTVEDIVEKVVSKICTERPEMLKQNIYSTCYNYVKRNFINLSLKNAVVWN